MWQKFGGVNVVVKHALSANGVKGSISCSCYVVCLYGKLTNNGITKKINIESKKKQRGGTVV